MKKTTVFINDLHSGSKYGAMTDKACDADNKVSMSKNQEPLYEHLKMVAKKWRNPDYIVMNGDLIDGPAKADKGTTVWTTNVDAQAQDAKRIINMFGKPKKYFCIGGTPYHTKESTVNIEEQIARDLGAVMEGNRYSTEAKLINLAPDKTANTANERIFHITHHMGATKNWQYRGTAPSKTMATLMLNESHFLERTRKIYGIIRAHVHHYWQEKSSGRLMQVLPCYQLQTPFMFKIMPESPPDIGSVRFTIHDDGTIDDEAEILPIRTGMIKVH